MPDELVSTSRVDVHDRPVAPDVVRAPPSLAALSSRGGPLRRLVVVSDTLALVAATLVPGFTGTFGAAYLAAAVLLDAVLYVLAWRVWREATPARAGVLFHYSLLYLALLFVAVAADAAIR